MPNELLLAADKGNLGAVTNLLKNNNINIHSHLKIYATDSNQIIAQKKITYITPLINAIKKKHNDVATLLLSQKNIEVETTSDQSHYIGGYKTVLAMSCVYKSDLSIYKTLLHKTHDLISGTGEFTLPDLIAAGDSTHDKTIRLSLLFEEAISRKDNNLIAEIAIVAKMNKISLHESSNEIETPTKNRHPLDECFSKFTHSLFAKKPIKNETLADSKKSHSEKLPAAAFIFAP